MTFRPLTNAQSEQLDSLRGMSAFAVVIGHANQILIAPAYDKLNPVMGLLAQSAVMIFFVMSGFLIGKSVSSNIARHGGRFSLMRYLVDRVIRIWPPLFFSLALIVCLYKLAPLFFPSGTSVFLPAPGHTLARTSFTSEPAQLYGAALMLNGFVTDAPSANGPLWSLSIEVWYYFLAAILAVPRGWWKVLALPFAGAVVWLGINNEPFLYYLPVWWAGYLLALLHDRLLSFSLNLLRGGAAICFLIALLLGGRFVSASYAHDPIADSLSLIASFNVAVGLGFCFILALVLQGSVSIPTVARAAAKYSYTLYIVHAPIFLFLFGSLQPSIQDSLGASVMVSLLAIVGVALFSATVSKAVENRRLVLSLFALRRKPQPLR